jgi:adenine deaminase
MNVQQLTAVARGEAPADLLLVGGRIVNTFTGAIEESHVAISQGYIAGVGNYQHGKDRMDLKRRYLLPGLIDGHVHPESSRLCPAEYAKALVPRGVLSIVTDFHEIANVAGVEGIQYMLDSAKDLPMDIFGMAPSCVPATHLETAGARLDADHLKQIMGMRNIIGLGEVMNFPGVTFGDPEMWEKIQIFQGRIVDGHCPGLSGKPLNAYLTAGIKSDHECISIEEAREKLNRGMYIMIREGSSEKNLEDLLPLATDEVFRRCFFVVDDRDCNDLFRDGDVDGVVRKAINSGLNPVRAVQMATINPAEYFRLGDLGAIAPGYRANLLAVDDLTNLRATIVFYEGRAVAREGELTVPVYSRTDVRLSRSVNIGDLGVESFQMVARGMTAPIIEMVPDQIVTRKAEASIPIKDGLIQADIDRDILKLAVVERHKATGNIGLGLVKGFGLKRGAMASTVAHDSHNIVVVGTNDRDMYVVVKALEHLQGGLTIASEGDIIDSLGLPIAGLLSDAPIGVVAEKLVRLSRIARDLGCRLSAPFTALSFLALPVIPELRLTDLGLVDVSAFKILKPGEDY